MARFVLRVPAALPGHSKRVLAVRRLSIFIWRPAHMIWTRRYGRAFGQKTIYYAVSQALVVSTCKPIQWTQIIELDCQTIHIVNSACYWSTTEVGNLPILNRLVNFKSTNGSKLKNHLEASGEINALNFLKFKIWNLHQPIRLSSLGYTGQAAFNEAHCKRHCKRQLPENAFKLMRFAGLLAAERRHLSRCRFGWQRKSKKLLAF